MGFKNIILSNLSRNKRVTQEPRTGRVSINKTDAASIVQVSRHRRCSKLPEERKPNSEHRNVAEPPSDEIPSTCIATIISVIAEEE